MAGQGLVNVAAGAALMASAGPPRPPRPAPGNPELAPGGHARPSTRGRVGEEATRFDAPEVNDVVIGEQVTLDSTVHEVGGKPVRIRIDVVAVTEEGYLVGLESKFGDFADLTKNQKIVIPRGGGWVHVIPRGTRAVEAGLTEGEPVWMWIDVQRRSWQLN